MGSKRNLGVDETLRSELTLYFQGVEELLGLKAFDIEGASSMRGSTGCPDPDRAAAQRHDHRGADLNRARMIHRAICSIPRAHTMVLDAVFGDHPWRTRFEQASGTGKWNEVQKHFGDLAGVSLLTEFARARFERDLAADKSPIRTKAHTVEGWLLLVCERDNKNADVEKSRAEFRREILAEANKLMRGAVWLYWSARPTILWSAERLKDARIPLRGLFPVVEDPWVTPEKPLRALRERKPKEPSKEPRMMADEREAS